ncbi:MAG: hypothetical protein IJ696_08515 [Ruminococcus sp.]|nr:hypothetical protein [Ruminococcus sp.]
MKKILDLIGIIMFFTIIVMFAIATLFFHPPKENGSKSSIRSTSDAEKLINEDFPLQNSFKALRSGLLLTVGKTELDGTYLIKDSAIRPADTIDDDEMFDYADRINIFAASHKDVSVYACVLPSASGIYSADIPSVGSGFDQRHFIDRLYNSIDSSVATLDAYSTLYSSRENYIFYRTAPCITTTGAFDVYYSMIRKMGFTPRPLSDYDSEHALSGFIGSLCSELSIRQQITPDNIELYTPKNGTSVTSAVCTHADTQTTYRSVFDRSALSSEQPLDVFLYGSNYEKVDITTINKDAPSLLIIKTPGADPVIPFLVSHYSKVTVIDERAADGMTLSSLADADSYDQVLFMADIENFDDTQGLDVKEIQW